MEPPYLKKKLPQIFLDLKKLAVTRKPSTLCCTSSALGLGSARSCPSLLQRGATQRKLKSRKPDKPPAAQGPVPMAQPQSQRQVRGLGPAQSNVAEPPGQLSLTEPLSSDPPKPLFHHLLGTSPPWIQTFPPPQRSTGAPAALGSAEGHHQVACTGWKEQAYAPGLFSTPQEAFEGTKGMMVFQTQRPEHLSWKPIVLPPAGQARGLVQGNTLSRDVAQETKQFSVETQTTKGQMLAPAQDTPGAPRVGV